MTKTITFGLSFIWRPNWNKNWDCHFHSSRKSIIEHKKLTSKGFVSWILKFRICFSFQTTCVRIPFHILVSLLTFDELSWSHLNYEQLFLWEDFNEYSLSLLARLGWLSSIVFSKSRACYLVPTKKLRLPRLGCNLGIICFSFVFYLKI